MLNSVEHEKSFITSEPALAIKVSIVLSVRKQLNINHEKPFNLHLWCSNVPCYADIGSYT